MRLIAAEALRARSRRVTWAVPAALVGLAALAAVLGSTQGEAFAVADRLPVALADVSPYVAWLAAAMGATLLGAEHADGGLTRVLAVEPRRGRVVAAKLAVAGVASAGGTLVAVAGVVAVLLLAAAVGPFTGAPADVLGGSLLGAAAALVAGGGLAGVLGGAAAVLGRSTVVGLVGCTVLLVLLEPGLGGLVEPLQGRGPFLSLLGAMGGPDSAAGSVVGAGASWPQALAWTAAAWALATVALARRDVVDGV